MWLDPTHVVRPTILLRLQSSQHSQVFFVAVTDAGGDDQSLKRSLLRPAASCSPVTAGRHRAAGAIVDESVGGEAQAGSEPTRPGQPGRGEER